MAHSVCTAPMTLSVGSAPVPTVTPTSSPSNSSPCPIGSHASGMRFTSVHKLTPHIGSKVRIRSERSIA